MAISSCVARPARGAQSPQSKHLNARTRGARVSVESVCACGRVGTTMAVCCRLCVSGRLHVTNRTPRRVHVKPCCDTSAARSRTCHQLFTRGLQPGQVYAWPVVVAVAAAWQRQGAVRRQRMLQDRVPLGKKEKAGIHRIMLVEVKVSSGRSRSE